MVQKMGDEIPVKTIFELLAAIFVSFFVTLPLAMTYYLTRIETEAVPFPEKEMGIIAASLNVIMFLLLSIIGSVVLYLLFKKLKVTLLKILFAITFFFSSTISILVINLNLFSLLSTYIEIESLAIIVAILLFYLIPPLIGAAIAAAMTVIKRTNVKNIITLLYCSLTGTLLGAILPILTFILLVLALSLYDIYNVRYGKLKDIIEIREKRREEMESVAIAYTGRYLEIGIGDLILYNALITKFLLLFEISGLICALIGVYVGVLVTFLLLRKSRIIPGLPIPIMVALLFTLAPQLLF